MVDTFAFDTIDLNIDGADPNVNVSVDLTKFTYVARCIMNLKFPTNAYEDEKFADDSALTNGLQFFYDDAPICDLIKTNSELGHMAYDQKLHSSDKNPKERNIKVRWTYEKAMPNPSPGLRGGVNHSLYVKVKDNMPALTTITSFKMTFQGHLYENDTAW